MLKLKNKYKLLLLIAVVFILITGAYASLQPSKMLSSTLTDPNCPESVSQSDSESSRRESSLVSANETETCLICNNTGILTKTIKNYLTCLACANTGRIICRHCSGSGRSELSEHIGTNICPRCQGTGRQTCLDCGGNGYKSETVTTQVKCPICKDKVPE